MKAIFISSSPSPKHLARLLETAQNILDKKEALLLIQCDADVASCKINFNKDLSVCNKCISLIDKSKKLLDGEFTSLNLSFENQYSDNLIHSICPKEFKTIEELKSFRYKTFDVGMTVASTLISHINSINVIDKITQKVIMRKIASSIFIYEQFLLYIDRFNIDAVYVHNGRHPHQKAMIQAALDKGVNFNCIEGAYDNTKKYRIYNNHLPHDYKRKTERINFYWNNSLLRKNNKLELGEYFFLDRLGKDFKNGPNHVKNQTNSLLPNNWNELNKNIVIFNTSSFEFAALNDIRSNYLFENEIEGITFIMQTLENKPDYQVYLRLHPNLIKGDEDTLKEYLELNFQNLTLIASDSPIDSYELAKRASMVVVSSSTMGIEASYMGIPVISILDTAYQGIDAVYEPKSREELSKLLLSDLKPKPRENTLKYGFYMIADGIPFKQTVIQNRKVFYRGEELSFTGTKKTNGLGFFAKLKKKFINEK